MSLLVREDLPKQNMHLLQRQTKISKKESKMKKTKIQEILDPRALWLIILLGGLCILIVINPFLKSDKFNPETDICVVNETTLCYLSFCDFNEKNIIEQKCNKSNCYYTQCVKWKPKTICELNPENLDCICDEWSNSCRFDSIGEYVYLSKFNESFEEWCLNNDGELLNKCIKSHLPNECEKNNSDWIWDEVDYICEKPCTQPTEKYCRKKIIYDLNCEELIYKYNSMNFLPNKYKDQILVQLAKKGCEI